MPKENLDNESELLLRISQGDPRAFRQIFTVSDALFYFRQAYDVDASAANTQTMYLAYLKMDQPERAMTYIDLAMGLQPNNQQLPIEKSLVAQIIKLKRALAVSAGRPSMPQ